VEKAFAIKKSIETDIEEAKRIGVTVEELEVNS
jgi:hypothetical protein